jgi:hypothetical protein
MATTTTRLGLTKPDFVDVVDISELNTNADDIDAAVGAAVVTSTTRPGAPWLGQIIHETDTDKTLVWDGIAWVEAGGAEDLDDLGDVTITSAASGDQLVYNGSGWVNRPESGRNLLYNGAMQVSQRGTSVTGITASGYFTADRWSNNISSLGTWTQTIEADAPTGSGFRNSLKVLCTTADASPAASDFINVAQALEGLDVQSILKGTSDAKELTVSFWVKANVTGTYVAELVDADNNRRVSASYSVASSATWEKKTITFPADTTGVFDNNNFVSLSLNFWLGAGSDLGGGSPLQTAWGTATNTRTTGQTNLGAATNNYWQVTGVQLELGDTASDFEFKPFGQELAECQRYYIRETATGVNNYLSGVGSAFSTTGVILKVGLPTTMRVAPISLDFSNVRLFDLVNAAIVVTAVTLSVGVGSNINEVPVEFTVASGLTQYRPYLLLSNTLPSHIGFSAEL